jgi:hypothetical protein
MAQATGTKGALQKDASQAIVAQEPTPEQIRARAYEIYLARNGGSGDELQDWLDAEQQLRSK